MQLNISSLTPELFILDTINVCVQEMQRSLCLLICLSAQELIRGSCSATLTIFFSASVLVCSHFILDAREQEIVCHLPIICDSSQVCRQNVNVIL